jgi:hypothetical protein
MNIAGIFIKRPVRLLPWLSRGRKESPEFVPAENGI